MRRLLAAGLLLAAACDPASPPSAGPPPSPLPPNNLAAMQRIFGPALAELDLRLTRTALIDRSGGRYEPSDEGRHLAMYAEPIGSTTTSKYVENIVPLTKIFVPTVFDRWSDLESFDICQEPMAAEDPEPRPVTQVNLTREKAEAMDWETLRLEDLIAAAREDRSDLTMVIASRVQKSPEWKRAFEAAGGGEDEPAEGPGY